MKFYTKTHEWIDINGNKAKMGITNHAQKALGDVVFVDLPDVGKELKKGDTIISVESVKAASDVYAPVSGKVIEINETLKEKPELINEDAEGKGWILILECLSNPDTSDLLDEEGYKKIVEVEG
ncbi:MAG: glycine cleavage system protein GcvH [Thermotoga sp.]|nr:MAG: glycine cleavage system protein GcvH [Thermotoga sp.]